MRAALPCAVYRLYDEWCTALYYGSSGNVFHRLGSHAAGQDWYPDVGMVLLDWYPTIEIARAVERGLILRDLPRHNVQAADSVFPPTGMPALPQCPTRVIWAPSPLPRLVAPRLQVTPPPMVDMVALLRDIQTAFGDAARISTFDLLASLASMGWQELANGTNSQARVFANWLLPLGIRAKTMRIPGTDSIVRGYARYQFGQHWSNLAG